MYQITNALKTPEQSTPETPAFVTPSAKFIAAMPDAPRKIQFNYLKRYQPLKRTLSLPSPEQCTETNDSGCEDSQTSKSFEDLSTAGTPPTPANSPSSSPRPLGSMDQSMTESDEDLYKYAEAMEYLMDMGNAATFLMAHTPPFKTPKKEPEESKNRAMLNPHIIRKLNFDDCE